MSLLDILLMSLAVWRVARIITEEEFVFGLARRFRLLCGVRESVMLENLTVGFDEDGFAEDVNIAHYIPYPSHLQPTLLARGITCVWCMSFWLGLLFGVLYMYDSTMTVYLAFPLAISSLAVGYDKVMWS